MMFTFSTTTITELVAQTRGLLQVYDDNGAVNDDFIESRIAKGIIPKFKSSTTWIPHECLFEICNRVVKLPCQGSDLMWIDLLDTDNEKVLHSGFLQNQNYHRKGGTSYPSYTTDTSNTQVANIGSMYEFYGNTIKFYTDKYNGYNIRVRFMAFMRDCECGEICVPEDYVEPIVQFAAYEWLRSTGTQNNMRLAESYKQSAYQLKKLALGESNKMNPEEYRSIEAMQTLRNISDGGYYRRLGNYVWY